jgi:hypothetical protein
MIREPAMRRRVTADEQRRAIAAVLPRVELTLEELWVRYFSLGGMAGLVEIDAFLHGAMPLPELERDLLAHAINERLDELIGLQRVPYTRVLRDAVPWSGPLQALVTLLDGAYLAAPEEIPVLIEDAAESMGVLVVTYLVDYDQRMLVPLPSPAAEDRPPLAVDATLAGRAYQLVQTLPSDHDDRFTLWVPVLDGVERVGVLDVKVPNAQDLDDPGLRAQCRWLAALVGHLLASANQYGDVLEGKRRRLDRTPAAELLWALLPPLATGVKGFTLAGQIEPSHTVGGDAFDYAQSAKTVSLAIFDAMGHALGASLIAACAIAAYRAARRAGHGVLGQAAAIDEAISSQFADAFCTGVVAELDQSSGRLQYVVAGHPLPLILREGKIVRSLAEGSRVPFGVEHSDVVLGEESLQPGDWLVLYTDGITEARADDGTFFGEERLRDFLTREAASGHPPPETCRRLIQDVLQYQHGELQDDATVVLARWESGEAWDKR